LRYERLCLFPELIGYFPWLFFIKESCKSISVWGLLLFLACITLSFCLVWTRPKRKPV
jgi:hypothetical protein